MDRLNLLPDDVILKILSMVPTKAAVTTCVLSKRWCSIWKHVPELTYYDDPSSDSEFWRASRFVDKFLLLHEAPVLDTLTLSLSQNCPPTDISTWISIAVSRGLRKLQFHMNRPCSTNIPFPRSLYTCQTLVTLRLHNAVIVDVPLTICFGSLKTMFLERVDIINDEIFRRLLSGCTVLERLSVKQCSYDKTFTVNVPSLKSLLVLDLKPASVQVPGDDVGVVIKAPSLRSLVISNQFTWVCSLVDMPKLVKAFIKLAHGDSKKLVGCLTSAKHLCLCVNSPMDSYPIGVFHQLVSLKLCTCSSHWLCLILRHTPKLRVLRFQPQVTLLRNLHTLERCHSSHGDVQTPSSVPECLVSSLETVEWIDYGGTEAEKKVVKYLLENSGQLKKIAVRCLPSKTLAEKLKMLKELAFRQRSFSNCRLSLT